MQRWRLQREDGSEVEQLHPPRLVLDDAGALLQAALAGVGCAVLPRLLAHDALQSSALQELLPAWTVPAGVDPGGLRQPQGPARGRAAGPYGSCSPRWSRASGA